MKFLSRCLSFAIAACLAFNVNLACGEWFADLYFGGCFSKNAGLDVPSDSIQDALASEPDNSFTGGARFGRWFEGMGWLGLSLDFSYFEPDIGKADLYAVPISPLLMFRLQLAPEDDLPHGTIQPYFAVGPSLLVSGIDLSLSDAGLSGGTYSDQTTQIGVDLRLGSYVHLRKNWAVLVECRYTYFKPEFKDNVQGSQVSIDPELETYYGQIGISYRF
jgi:hypothetical protein